MGRIKSALEIAMEKTESVKGDKASIGLFEAKQRGKRLANQFLTGEVPAIEVELKKAASSEEQNALKEGCFEIFISQITLPDFPEDIKRLETIGKGLVLIIEDKSFSVLYRQFLEAAEQYLKETAQYEEAIRQQYAPRLHQKEEELSRRMGRQIKLDPFQDPEFVAFYNQHINALKANYEPMIDEAQKHIRELFTAVPDK